MGLQSVSGSSKREYQKRLRAEKRQNILNQEFSPASPNAIWVSDITSFKIKDQWLHICVIIDLFSRKVIAHKLSQNSSTQLVTSVLKQALASRNPNTATLLFHSDQGSQFTSFSFKALLKKHRIKQSFSNPGKPYNNSVVESFFSNLKREEIYRTNYRSERAFISQIGKYIEFYNDKRPHRTLAFRTPNKFESNYEVNVKMDKGGSEIVGI